MRERQYNECPGCRSTAVNFYTAGPPLPLGAPDAKLPEPTVRCECRQCGHKWMQVGKRILSDAPPEAK